MNKKITFETVAKEWLSNHVQNVKANSYRGYVIKVNQLIKIIDKPFCKIEYADLQKILNDMYYNGRAKSTIHKTKVTLGLIYKYAMQHNIIDKNPCQFTVVPRRAKKSVRKGITEDETIAIVKNINNDFGLYPFMLLFLGLRREELIPLKCEDIDFIQKKICIHAVVNYSGNIPIVYEGLKNGDDARYVSIPQILYSYLLKYKNRKGYLFTNDNDELLLQNQLRKLWDNYKIETGINATQHQLRHTYATMLFESGVDLKTAQDLMGHKDVRTMLQFYTHLSAANKAKNITKLDSYILNKYDKMLPTDKKPK